MPSDRSGRNHPQRTVLLAFALALAVCAPAATSAHADSFTARTVQSPANPVAAGAVVTYTTTVTNTSGESYPFAPRFFDDTVLDMFLTRYRADRPPPNQYRTSRRRRERVRVRPRGRPRSTAASAP